MVWLAACGVIPWASAALRMLPSSIALAKAVMARISLKGMEPPVSILVCYWCNRLWASGLLVSRLKCGHVHDHFAEPVPQPRGVGRCPCPVARRIHRGGIRVAARQPAHTDRYRLAHQ